MSTRACWLFAFLLLISLPLVSGSPFYRQLLLGFGNDVQSPPKDIPGTIDQVLMKALGGKLPGRKAGRSLGGGGLVSDGIDMMLNKQQYRDLHTGVRGRTNGHRTIATPWTDGVVPYEIKTSDFNKEQTDWILGSMRNWEKHTCVTFRPATRHDANKIKIVNGEGCSAALGMQGGEQPVNLNTRGCFWTGTVEHELGHALGLIHEHQRQQRDRYLKIDYFACSKDGVEWLTKYAEGADDKMGLDFDYHSVMHYGTTAFSADGYSTTIYTRDPTKQDVIGMILGPSYIDVHLINLMYKCEEKHRAKCPNAPRCASGCFLNKDCRCFCERDMPKEECKDNEQHCAGWAASGDCHRNPGYMHHHCRKSCNICTEDGSVPQMPCADYGSTCPSRAQNGECSSNPSAMVRDCRKSCGYCTEGEDFTALWESCRDLKADCRRRVDQDECDKNPRVMLKECRQSCDFCPQDMHREKIPGPCEDYDTVCVYRATNGMCEKHYNLISVVECRSACNSCDASLPEGCEDLDENCRYFAVTDQCDSQDYAAYMNHNCKLSCDKCVVVSADCRDNATRCSEWAAQGGCNRNPEWMNQNCALSCDKCVPAEVVCEDGNRNCPAWAGHCSRHDIREACPKTCGTC